MPIINILGFQCYRCDHEWAPAVIIHAGTLDYKLPTVCPKCKSAWWDSPREKDILKIINSGGFQQYNPTPLIIFVKSHFKQGDDAKRILDCIYSLPAIPPINPKKWLEEKINV